MRHFQSHNLYSLQSIPLIRLPKIACCFEATELFEWLSCCLFDRRKTVPYGLGGPSRSRRSLKDMAPAMLPEPSSRCRCANQNDKKCLNFCQAGKDLWCVCCCYSLKGSACERDCERLTHFDTCWANTLFNTLPPTWVLTLLRYTLCSGPERLLIRCLKKQLMRFLSLWTASLVSFLTEAPFHF